MHTSNTIVKTTIVTYAARRYLSNNLSFHTSPLPCQLHSMSIQRYITIIYIVNVSTEAINIWYWYQISNIPASQTTKIILQRVRTNEIMRQLSWIGLFSYIVFDFKIFCICFLSYYSHINLDLFFFSDVTLNERGYPGPRGVHLAF